MFYSIRRPDVLSVTLAAAGILMVTMGTRQSFGLFISPINGSTGMGIATISLALAIGQNGGFLGAWLGGITMSQLGDFSWMWYADIALAILAALVNLPI